MRSSVTVSVVMPVYNTAEYLDEAIESILGQTLRDIEFIIIDDGSTDGSSDILARYAEQNSRIRLLRQKNSGVAATKNKALELAEGRYIAMMDSDDISVPDRLARQVAFMDSHPEVGVCGTACSLFGDNRGITRPRTESEEIKSWLLFGPCMAHPTIMMRRDLVSEHGFRYDQEFKQAEDYDLWLRCSTSCEMANIPESLLHYRVWGRQATSRFQPEVHQWSGLVQEKAIRLLGIEPSEEELRLHLSLHSSSYEKSREYVERVEKWLSRLLEANRKNSVRDEKAFASVVFEVWRCLLAGEADLGLWMWRKFTRSEIFQASGQHSGFSLALFFIRACLSNAFEKTHTGREFKRFARGFDLRVARNRG